MNQNENRKIIDQVVLVGGADRDYDDTITPKVKAHIDAGWQPVGPTMCTGQPRFDFFQTMVRYQEDPCKLEGQI